MKTHLITGAAKGLGRELAKQLALAGDQVILLDKEMKPLIQLYDELEEIVPGKVSLYPIDLLGANIDHYNQLGEILQNDFPELDCVFLNAAILPAFTPIASFDYSQWYEVLHTNLNANFHLIQQTLPGLLNAKGKLIAISDRDCFEKPAYYGAYGVAKAGLEQLLSSLSKEHCEKCLEVVIARTPAFATESRGRLFPGENPTELPQANEIAAELLAKMGIQGKVNSDLIEMNFLKN